MKETILFLKALSDETRLRILALLRQGELCVCDLMAVLQMPQSTVSRHLTILRQAGWVTARRQGRWVYFRLAEEGKPIQMAFKPSLFAHLAALAVSQKDQERLALYLLKKSRDACE